MRKNQFHKVIIPIIFTVMLIMHMLSCSLFDSITYRYGGIAGNILWYDDNTICFAKYIMASIYEEDDHETMIHGLMFYEYNVSSGTLTMKKIEFDEDEYYSPTHITKDSNVIIISMLSNSGPYQYDIATDIVTLIEDEPFKDAKIIDKSPFSEEYYMYSNSAYMIFNKQTSEYDTMDVADLGYEKDINISWMTRKISTIYFQYISIYNMETLEEINYSGLIVDTCSVGECEHCKWNENGDTLRVRAVFVNEESNREFEGNLIITGPGFQELSIEETDIFHTNNRGDYAVFGSDTVYVYNENGTLIDKQATKNQKLLAN